MAFPKAAPLVLFAFVAPLLVGCGGGPATKSPDAVSLYQLAKHYGMFISSHKGKGPKDAAELRTFISAKDAGADLDALFRSTRDGEPYTLIFGEPKGSPPVFAYEKNGVGGKRLVAFATTEVRELDDAAFQKAIGK